MTESTFGYMSLVTESLRLAWQKKSLWVLGLLLGGAGSYQIQESLNYEELANDGLGVLLILILLAIGMVMFVIYLVLNSIAEGGLVHSGNNLATGRPASLGDGWRVGGQHWLKNLGLTLLYMLLALPISGILIGVPVGLGILVHPMIGVLTGLVTGGVWFVVYLFIAPWFSYARRHAVLADTSLGAGLGYGADLVRRQPVRAAAISLVRFVYLVAVLIPIFFIGAMLIAPILILWEISGVIGVFAILFFVVPIMGVISAYTNTAGNYFWTLAYLWQQRTAPDRPDPPFVPGDADITDSGR